MAGKKAPPAPVKDAAEDIGIEDLTPEELAGAKPPRFGSKQKIIAAAGALLLLGGGGGVALLMSGGEKPGADKHEEKASAEEEAEGEGEAEGGELPLVDVPAMIVNMRTAGGQPRYLKIRFMIEARSSAKVEPLKAKLPAIIDSYQPFLRELRPEDLSGSAAVFRIKEELLSRATAAVGSGMVKDILIQDLVQQ
ncbi:flagellar basal body-associated FliL family protein [Sphingobium subterraneum]|uniref:Flagellar protein FliL n=1 Tax=Sphingobium subterraneum TaxID=627688 RepID=A0A841IWV9_9SPHN|nr:flagellar basal body-associated FliL family protein [Sphingobium subterraneum]MBB6122770.1 flagellar FliL protein [Sphingobium subterraneum]